MLFITHFTGKCTDGSRSGKRPLPNSIFGATYQVKEGQAEAGREPQ